MKAITGRKIDITDMTAEAPVSIEDTMGFPNPAVETEEVALVAEAPLLMAAAVPPPAIMARDHMTTGSKLVAVTTTTKVPAMLAKGMAIVSNKLSTNGI